MDKLIDPTEKVAQRRFSIKITSKTHNTMETKKIKVMRGSEKHPELVKEWLKVQGATNVENYDCDSKFYYYFVVDGKIYTEYTEEWIWKCIDHEVVELKPQHVFQPFDKVLARCCEGDVWQCDIYSHCDTDNTDHPHCCVGNFWSDVIPYEGNEHLLGTTDSPKEGGER